VANLPSVLSNTWLGILVAGGPASGIHAAAVSVSAASLYLAGTFINDWADRRWDSIHRPERALPRRIFPSGLYLSIAMWMAALAMTGAALVSPHTLMVSAGILLCMGIYTWLHKKSAWAVMPMGLCRGLLPLLGLASSDAPAASVTALPAAVLAGGGLFLHVASISWLARSESRLEASSRNPQKSAFKPPLVGFCACAIMITGGSSFILGLPAASIIAGVLPYVIWTSAALLRRRLTVAGRVSAMLAGIPLVDWALLLPLHLASTNPAGTPFECTYSICLWLPPAAFILGLLVQRSAPAT
jgi:4-hydroxybenzoate polyprenyltransferase